jgi:cellulose synthase/poly-beta-1,6-N-acetylglucosamine synthase-like glycosyltransferase
VLLLEVLLSKQSGANSKTPDHVSNVRAIVLVPAHNERSGISATVKGLLQQLAPGDEILVVSDNCNDETAALARAAGALVLERHDAVKRGKGYALAHGLSEINRRKPDVVIFVDADCMLSAGAIAQLKSTAWSSGRPVQAAFVMGAPEGHELRYAVATFAWRIKNLVRPLGLFQMGLPCQMMGTGMAMRLDIANRVTFASGNIVEDLELGLNLAAQGLAPVFEPRALVQSVFPVTTEGEIAQRRRWEGGSIAMLASRGTKTVLKGLMGRNVGALALGFDMLVPPLVTHAAALIVFGLVSGLFWLVTGFAMPLSLAVCLALCFACAILVAWFKAGRDVLPLKFWVQLMPFVLKKFKIHKSLPSTEKAWVRADRRKDEGEA